MNKITKIIITLLSINLILSIVVLFIPLIGDPSADNQYTYLNILNFTYKIFILINIHILILSILDILMCDSIEIVSSKFKIQMILSSIGFTLLFIDTLSNIDVVSLTIGFIIYLLITGLSISIYILGKNTSKNLS